MWRELREQTTPPRELATGLAIGVFIANLPIYGLQTLLGLYTARRLHLNPLSVVAGTHVSTPPVGPLLIAAAIGTGHLVMHGTWLTMAAWPTSFTQWAHLLGSLMVEWTVGSLIVGAALATAVFFVSDALLRLVAVERREVRQRADRQSCLSPRPVLRERPGEGSAKLTSVAARVPSRNKAVTPTLPPRDLRDIWSTGRGENSTINQRDLVNELISR